MTNTVGDFMKSVFPTLVNKNGKIFTSLFTDSKGNGTLEKLWNEIETVRKKWAISDLYLQNDEQQEKTLNAISVLEKGQNESEASFLSRNKLLFYRKGFSVWGTKWDIQSIFKSFFKNENTWVINNCENYSESLLINGDFEKDIAWTFENCTLSKEALFEETQGVLFNGVGTCQQSVDVKINKTYFLHFFLRGKLKVKIKDNLGRYWNKDSGDFGEWTNNESYSIFSSEQWNNKNIFFITDDSSQNITIIFEAENEQIAFLDYVRFFEKSHSQTFTLLSVFEGEDSGETARLAPGESDPLESAIDYKKMTYFENAFAFGAMGRESSNMYKELLEIVQPAGITGCIELLNRKQN